MTPEQRRARQKAVRAWFAREGERCRVKLCGMFREQDIAVVNACLPDMAGFITDFPKSHRSVLCSEAGRLAVQVDPRVYTVAVSVDLPVTRVAYSGQCYVDVVQLHGHEDNGYIAELRKRTGAGIMQAFRIRSAADVEAAFASAADMVLLDAGKGSGETFDWSLVEGFGTRRPFVLAGGLDPTNVAEAVRTLQPWGVDMSSGIETDRLKDPAKMAAAVAAVRSAS